MNGYIEDDSGELLGDYLLSVTDENLAKMLLQANGQVVVMIQEKLAYALDNGKSTWLDRMEKLGGYDGLKATFTKAYNGDSSKAVAAIKKKYHQKCQSVFLDAGCYCGNHL